MRLEGIGGLCILTPSARCTVGTNDDGTKGGAEIRIGGLLCKRFMMASPFIVQIRVADACIT